MLNRLQSREETFFKEGGVDVAESEEREQLLEVVRHAYIFNFVHALVLNTQSSVLRYSFRFSATTGIFSTTLARRCEKAWIRLESFSSCLTKRQIEYCQNIVLLLMDACTDYRWSTKRRSRRLCS